MTTASAATGWLVVFAIGVVAPVAILILMALTPDTLLRTGAAGRFVSSTASAGGFMAPNISTVQTTTGSVAVYKTFSAPQNEMLVIRQSLKDGLQLCAEGKPDTCTELTGSWAGDMKLVPHAHHLFAGLVTDLGSRIVSLWLVVGMLATVGAAGVLAQLIDADQRKPKQAT